MKYFKLIFFLCLNTTAFSQVDSSVSHHDSAVISLDTTAIQASIEPTLNTAGNPPAMPLPTLKAAKVKMNYPKNAVKFNIGSLFLFDNYNFVYERSLTRKISASLGYRTMPTTQLNQLGALKNIYKIIGEDESSLEEDMGNKKASNKTITTEFRFYGGSKPGPRGFYLGLYGRYANFNVDYNYLFKGSTDDYPIPITSTTKGLGGGLLIGVQWLIRKRVAIDWQILGGQWGKLTGDGSSIVDLSQMSAQDKEDLKYELEDLLPSFGDKSTISANVKDNGVNLKVDGPFAGLRSGISIGIAF